MTRDQEAILALTRRVQVLEGVIENLQVQSVSNIAPGWVSVPAVEWEANMEAALSGGGK